MFGRNVKMAIAGLRRSKWRSLLTMTGIIIGVASVVTAVSLGEGVKKQVVGQVNKLGSDLITIRPGNLVTRNKQGEITHVNIAAGFSFASSSLNESDLLTIKKTAGVKDVVPISIASQGAKADQAEYNDGVVIGTSAALADVIKQNVAFGTFFEEADSNRNIAIIGQQVAEQLFHENVPIGMTLTIHGQDFIVRGIFDKFSGMPVSFGPDFNKAIFIPYNVARTLNDGNSPIMHVLVRVNNEDQTSEVVQELNQNLHDAHGGQNDFTVLRQDENLTLTGNLLNLFTGLIAGIAAISLLVGGIGVMNIMLVLVTERTREIGIRKAVGATNRQILSQFLIEATVLSLVGGIIGVFLSVFINYLLRIFTNLNPVISWQVVLVAWGVTVGVGIIFGLTPALRAARKDPIEALRYE
jgi:putative ABC transport system permease protein